MWAATENRYKKVIEKIITVEGIAFWNLSSPEKNVFAPNDPKMIVNTKIAPYNCNIWFFFIDYSVKVNFQSVKIKISKSTQPDSLGSTSRNLPWGSKLEKTKIKIDIKDNETTPNLYGNHQSCRHSIFVFALGLGSDIKKQTKNIR